MSEIITATYRDGAFVPEHALGLAAGTRVRLTVEPVEQTSAQAAVAAHHRPTAEEITDFNKLCDRLSVRGGKRLTRDELHERR